MRAPFSSERQLNPFPWYQTMREDAPVWYSREQGIWHVFRYDDVQRVLSDYAHFSSQRNGGNEAEGHLFASSMISSDPPRHRKLRGLATQAFTPRAVEALEPRIADITQDLLNRVAGHGRMDVIEDLAYPLPVIVIAELLGIPAEDRERFKLWSDAVVSTAQTMGNGMPPYHVGDAMREMAAYFAQTIEQRRRRPGDDLISGLLAAQIDGEHLTLQELLGFCALLLVAGNETTTNLLGNAILSFTEQPGLWERLRAQPELLPMAIEEVLRYRSPVQSMFRSTVSATTMAEQTIPAGSPVIAWIGSANRDELQFPDPNRFDVERTPNRHIAFGYGIHYCLGAPLARLEARIALSAMLERFPTITREGDAPLEALPSMIVYGVRNLPIAL
jgi:cytochrome P450